MSWWSLVAMSPPMRGLFCGLRAVTFPLVAGADDDEARGLSPHFEDAAATEQTSR